MADELSCVIKLYAESEQRQKLIGILSFPINWLKEPFDSLNMQAVPFKKCVDRSALIVISTKIQSDEQKSKQTVQKAVFNSVQNKQIKLSKVSKGRVRTTIPFNLDDECDAIEVNDEGARP